MHEKTRLCDHNRALLCPGPPPERGVGRDAAQVTSKRGADVRVALSTHESLVMPSLLWGGGSGCTRVLVQCRFGTVLPAVWWGLEGTRGFGWPCRGWGGRAPGRCPR